MSVLRPPEKEHSLTYLGKIFGNMGPNSQWANDHFKSPLVGMFEVFNHVILIFGIVVIIYTTIVASLNTAYHGKMMGDKWSSLWVPIRIVLGFALLIPQANGYALIQSLVMWLVIQSVGAADSLWRIMVDNMVALHSIEEVGATPISEKIPTTYKPSAAVVEGITTDLIRPIFRVLVCQAYYHPDERADLSKGIHSEAPTPNGTVLMTFYGGTDNSKLCGSISITRDKKLVDAKGVTVADQLVAEQKTAVERIARDLTPVANRVGNLSPSLEVKEAKVELDKLSLMATTGMASATNYYIRKMFTFWRAQQNLTSDTKKTVADKLKQEGWIYGGSYYIFLNQKGIASKMKEVDLYKNNINASTQMAGAAIDIVNLPYRSVVGQYDALYKRTGSEPSDISGRMLLNADRVTSYFTYVVRGEPPPTVALTTSLGRQAVASMLTYYQKSENIDDAFDTGSTPSKNANTFWRESIVAFMKLTHVDLMPDSASEAWTKDPILVLVDYGKTSANLVEDKVKLYQKDIIFWAKLDALAQMAGGALSGAAAGLSGGMGAPLSGLIPAMAALGANLAAVVPRLEFTKVTAESTVVIGIGLAFFAQAVLLGIYVPLIPFIMFTFGVLGWFMIVIEAMVAAPIVALGATIPEGNEVYGKAVPALMLVANLCLRPVLMLFGLYGAILLADVVIVYFTQGFDILFVRLFGVTTAQNMYYWTAIIFVYAALLVAILQRCFSLIGHLPDRVLRWIGDTSAGVGGGEEALGEARGAAGRGADTSGQMGTSGVEAEKRWGEGVSQAGGSTGSAMQTYGRDVGAARKEAKKNKDKAFAAAQAAQKNKGGTGTS